MKKVIVAILALLVLSALALAYDAQNGQNESVKSIVIHAVVLDIHNDSALQSWFNESYTGSMNFSEFKAWTLQQEADLKSMG